MDVAEELVTVVVEELVVVEEVGTVVVLEEVRIVLVVVVEVVVVLVLVEVVVEVVVVLVLVEVAEAFLVAGIAVVAIFVFFPQLPAFIRSQTFAYKVDTDAVLVVVSGTFLSNFFDFPTTSQPSSSS